MASLVLDASAALAILLPDEDASQFHTIGQGLGNAVVPAIWHVEVGNALLVQMRRKRLLPASAAEAFERFPILATEVDTETTQLGWRSGLRLAERPA